MSILRFYEAKDSGKWPSQCYLFKSCGRKVETAAFDCSINAENTLEVKPFIKSEEECEMKCQEVGVHMTVFIFSNKIKGVCTISILDNDLGTSCLTFVWFQTALIFVWHTNLWCMSLALSYLASQPIIGPIEKQNTCAVSYQPLPISRLRDKFIVPYLSFLLTIDTRICI